jgi:hypothetical protein
MRNYPGPRARRLTVIGTILGIGAALLVSLPSQAATPTSADLPTVLNQYGATFLLQPEDTPQNASYYTNLATMPSPVYQTPLTLSTISRPGTITQNNFVAEWHLTNQGTMTLPDNVGATPVYTLSSYWWNSECAIPFGSSKAGASIVAASCLRDTEEMWIIVSPNSPQALRNYFGVPSAGTGSLLVSAQSLEDAGLKNPIHAAILTAYPNSTGTVLELGANPNLVRENAPASAFVNDTWSFITPW